MDTRTFNPNSDFSNDPNFTALRNFILCKIFPPSNQTKLYYQYNKINEHSFNVKIKNFDDVQNIAYPFIDISNAMAIAYYTQGIKSIQKMSEKNMLYKLIDDLSVLIEGVR